MNFQYNVTEKDWELAQATSCGQYSSMGRSSWSSRAAWWLVFIFLGIALASSVGMFRKYGEIIAFDFSFAFVSAALSYASLVAFQKLSARSTKLSVLRLLGPFPLEHHLTVSDNNIAVANRHGQSTFPWSTIVGIKEVDSHIMLIVRPGSVVPIPPSAFTGPETRDAFLTHVRRAVGP